MALDSGKTAFLFLTQVISVALLFVTSILLARNLTPMDYGDFSTGYSCLAIAYVICLLGADIVAFKFVSVNYSKGDLKGVNSYMSYVFGTVIVTSGAFYAASLLIFLITRYQLHVDKIHPVFVAMIFTPILALTYFLYKVLTSLSSPVLSNVIYKVLLNLSTLALVLIMVHMVHKPSAHISVVFFLISWLIILLAFAAVIVRRTQYTTVGRSPIHIQYWLWPSLSAMPFSIALQALANLGVICVELFAANEDSVGHYAGATAVAQVLNLLFGSLAYTLYLSQASLHVDRNEPRELRALIRRHLHLMGASSAVFLLFIALFGKDILALYGESYVDAYGSLVLLTMMQVVVLLCSLATPILNYKGRYAITATFSIVNVALIVPVCYFMYRLFGVTGVALGLLISVVGIFLPKQILLMYENNKDIRAASIAGTTA